MRIAIVSREYEGICEAGGVKNVTKSLSENLSKNGHEVYCFLPVYGCSKMEKFVCSPDFFCKEKMFSGKDKSFSHNVEIFNEKDSGVNFIFIEDPVFSSKKGVYTYTKEEEKENPSHPAGCGHVDSIEEDIIFQRKVVEKMLDFPFEFDVVHCQDAACALVCVFAKNLDLILPAFENSSKIDILKGNSPFSDTHFLVTIHNAGLGYHHNIFGFEKALALTKLPPSLIEKGFMKKENSFEPFALSAYFSTLTTVSEKYAEELKDPSFFEINGELSEFFNKNDTKISGITNGIDFENYDPSFKEKSLLPFVYDCEKLELEGKYLCRKEFFEKYFPEADEAGFDFKISPVFCFHGRLVSQKGVEILFDGIPKILEKNPETIFLIMGQGEKRLEEKALFLSERFPKNLWYFQGYDKKLSRLMIASSDFIVLPSLFEPCGLEDFIAQIFGTIPIAHQTGGLCKIIDDESIVENANGNCFDENAGKIFETGKQTGFLYEKNNSFELSKKIISIMEKFYDENGIKREKINPIIKNAAINVKENYSWQKIIKKYEEIYQKK